MPLFTSLSRETSSGEERREAAVGIKSRASYCTHNFHPDASPVNMAAGFEDLSTTDVSDLLNNYLINIIIRLDIQLFQRPLIKFEFKPH